MSQVVKSFASKRPPPPLQKVEQEVGTTHSANCAVRPSAAQISNTLPIPPTTTTPFNTTRYFIHHSSSTNSSCCSENTALVNFYWIHFVNKKYQRSNGPGTVKVNCKRGRPAAAAGGFTVDVHTGSSLYAIYAEYPARLTWTNFIPIWFEMTEP